MCNTMLIRQVIINRLHLTCKSSYALWRNRLKYSLVIVVVFLFGISKEINAQWIKTNGPYGADVTSVLIHNGYKFAGTSNGIYRSTMKVSTWELGKASLFGNRIQALVADTKNIYAGTRNGIYVSSDEGISWHQTDLSDRIITELAVKDTLIFAGTVNGILVSSDKGFTWKEIDSGLVSKNVIVLATNQDMIFVSTEYDGLYSSSNNGTDWNKLNFEKNVIFAVGFWGNSIFVSSNDNVVYRSTNLGETWMSSVIGENTNSVINFATWQNKVFAATNYGLYESLDSGKTWQPSSLTKIFIHELFIYDTCFLAGTMQGAYTSLDAGLNWIETNDGLLSGDVTSLASSGSKIFAGTYGFKVFQSTDNGTTWSKYSNGISNAYISGLGLAKDYLLAGTNGGIFRTGVSLDSWMKVSSDYMQTGSRSFILNDNEIFAGSDFGVLQSTDDGKTWKRIDSLQASSYYQVWDVLAFDSTIIAGYNQMGIRKSNDNGLNWNFSNTGLWDYITVNALTSEGQNILAGTSGLGVVLSSDRGKTWFSSKLDSMQILTFQRFGNFVFAGANNGVYRSING